MGRLLIIIFFFSFFVDDAVSEIQNNPLDCTKNLQRLLSFVNTMSADFKQTNYTEKNTITQEAYGYLITKKPGNIIWITKAILEQKKITNNRKKVKKKKKIKNKIKINIKKLKKKNLIY